MPVGAVKPLGTLVALALVLGCGQQGDSSANQPAGRVVELAGSVQAAREGGEPRALGQDDPVYRDDTVTTGADGSVTILLAHNQARWSLAAGKSRRVDRSAAWRAESGAGSGSAFDDERALPTTSARRHSEPQAGETRATAPAPAAEAPAAAAPADRVAEAPPPAREGRPRRSRRKPEERAKGSAAPRTRGLALGAAPDTGSAAESSAEDEAAPMAVSSDRRATLGPLSVSGARGKKELAAHLAAALGPGAQLCAEVAAQSGEVAIAFEIDTKGEVGDVKLSGSRALMAAVASCLRKKIDELSFPRRREGTTRVRQTVRFEVP